MIDHDYKIITREVAMTESRAKHFVAELSDVYVIVDGKRIAGPYPRQEFFGKTQTAALTQASDTLRSWLDNQNNQLSISVEDCVALPK